MELTRQQQEVGLLIARNRALADLRLEAMAPLVRVMAEYGPKDQGVWLAARKKLVGVRDLMVLRRRAG